MNIQISGNLSGPTAIFIAGWPDTCDVFRDNIMATLAADYRIVGITLPGFDDEHPFLQKLREKGLSSSLGEPHPGSGARALNSSSDYHCTSWLPSMFPFSCFQPDNTGAQAGATEDRNSCLVNSLRIAGGKPPLQMLHTTWKGHSFQDLVTMLEIAVDTAMETCNYCPSTIPSTAAVSASTAKGDATNSTSAAPAAASSSKKMGGAAHAGCEKRRCGGAVALRMQQQQQQEVDAENSEDGTEAVPLHQLPPTYTRPVLIAHDWGCFLAYELITVRPELFSRFVALDLGAYVFESKAAQVERMCALVSRTGNSYVAASTYFAASHPHTRGFTLCGNPGEYQPKFPLSGQELIDSPLIRDALGEAEGASLQSGNRREAKWDGQVSKMHQNHRPFSEAAAGIATESAFSPPLSVQAHNSRSNSPRGTPTSSPVMVAHSVPPGSFSNMSIKNIVNGTAGHFNGLPSAISSTSQLRNSVSGSTTKRSLASQYAIRRKKPTQPTQHSERWKGIAIVTYQWFLIACTIFIPRRFARWLVGCFASFIGRPTYSYDPQIVSTPAVELLNQMLNAQFFAQHPYALENRAAFDLSVLPQVQEMANLSSRLTESSFPSINLAHTSLMRIEQPPRLLPGWKFMLIPCIEGKPVSGSAVLRSNVHIARIEQPPHCVGSLSHLPCRSCSAGRRQNDAQECRLAGATAPGKGCCRGTRLRDTRHTSSQSDQSHCSLSCKTSLTSTDVSQDDVSSSLLPGRAEKRDAQEQLRDSATAATAITVSSAVTDYTIYSSYAKGAGLFEEWNAPVEGLGRVNANTGLSGELDPYMSVLTIPYPLWAAEDPLALTGAQTFQETRRCGMKENEDYLLISPDRDGFSWRSNTATVATNAAAAAASNSASSSSSHVQVIKRKIFYQAIAFPPLAPPKNASSSSLASEMINSSSLPAANNTSMMLNNRNNNDDALSSRSTHSTMLDQLRRSHCKATIRPSVPVLASPLQGWVYLRYWLGMLLVAFMTFATWLFGEKKPGPTAGTGDSNNSNTGNNSSTCNSKAYSNVMTTAMTTIYRRLPATPSLAASTANLPGDGDAVLRAEGYSPLVSQRFFVPLPVPVLFMYGGAKKIMLHADHWCTYVRQYQRPRDGISDVVEVQGGGHWFFAEKKYQKKVADRIAEFLAAEQKSPLGV